MNPDQPANTASVATDSVAAAAEMTDNSPSAIGARLRAARESRGETQGEIAQDLKLSVRQIEALESGNYTGLPGPAFVRGFLRNYARHLGMDPKTVAVTLPDEAPPTSANLTPISNAGGALPNGSNRASTLPIGTLVTLLVIVILAGWWFDWFNPNTQETDQTSDTSLSAAAAEHDETAALPHIEAGGGAIPPSSEAQPLAPSASAETATPATPPSGAASAVPSATRPAAGATADVPAAATPSAAGANNLAALDFSFSGNSWIEVRDASNTIVYTGTSTAGQSRTVQGTPPFALVIGNAADVRLNYNGAPVDLTPHTKVAVARLTLK